MIYPADEQKLREILQELPEESFFSLLDGIPLEKQRMEKELLVGISPMPGKILEWNKESGFLFAQAGVTLACVRDHLPAFKELPLPFPDSFYLLTLIRQEGLTPSPFLLCADSSSFVSARGIYSNRRTASFSAPHLSWPMASLLPLPKAPQTALLAENFFPFEFSLFLRKLSPHRKAVGVFDRQIDPEKHRLFFKLLLKQTITAFFWHREIWHVLISDNYPALLEQKLNFLRHLFPDRFLLPALDLPVISEPFILQGRFRMRDALALLPLPFKTDTMYCFPVLHPAEVSVVIGSSWQDLEQAVSYFLAFNPLRLSLFPENAHHHH